MNGIELAFFLIFGVLMLLFIFIRFIISKKTKELLTNSKYINEYFSSDLDLKKSEYVPTKERSINKKKESIYMAKTFLIFVYNGSIKRIDYKDIYFAYGSVTKNKKDSRMHFEAIILKTIKGSYTIYVKEQEPYIRILAEMGILTGYTKKNKILSKVRKKKLKELKKENK